MEIIWTPTKFQLRNRMDILLGVKNCTLQPLFSQEEVNGKTFPFFTSSKKYLSNGHLRRFLRQILLSVLSDVSPHYNTEAGSPSHVPEEKTEVQKVKTIILGVCSLELRSLKSM